jgi:hypothetical protein
MQLSLDEGGNGWELETGNWKLVFPSAVLVPKIVVTCLCKVSVALTSGATALDAGEAKNKRDWENRKMKKEGPGKRSREYDGSR